MFTALTLITGSIWGRPTWGVWWAWDARLTSTAMLLVLHLGYLAIRRVPGDLDAAARRCAVVALVAAVDVPIVHFSVVWWHTLHQGATVLNANLSPTIHGSMAWTLLLGFVAFTLLFVWMLAMRYRIEVLSEHLQGVGARRGARRAVGGRDGPIAAEPGGALASTGRQAWRSRAMSYIDAGYAVALGTLAAYAATPVAPAAAPRAARSARRGQRAP